MIDSNILTPSLKKKDPNSLSDQAEELLWYQNLMGYCHCHWLALLTHLSCPLDYFHQSLHGAKCKCLEA